MIRSNNDDNDNEANYVAEADANSDGTENWREE